MDESIQKMILIRDSHMWVVTQIFYFFFLSLVGDTFETVLKNYLYIFIQTTK